MMKKLFTLALAAVMALSLVACGGKTETKVALKDGTALADVFTAVDEKFTETYGEGATAVAMGMPIDEAFLTDFLELGSDTYEEFAGSMSMSMTNSDAFFAVKAKEGKLDAVKAALEKRIEGLRAQYEMYPVSGSYDRAKAAEVYVKGDYAFLICVGVLSDEKMEQEAVDFSGDVTMTKAVIDGLFTA